jgi:hypothetical protein
MPTQSQWPEATQGTVKSTQATQRAFHGSTVEREQTILRRLLVRRRQDLGAFEPAHSLAWEPCPEPGNGAASPLFSID